MNPIRLIFGAMLVSLCVFGLPEGCLVLASHAKPPSLLLSDTEPITRISHDPVGKQPSQEVPSLLP